MGSLPQLFRIAVALAIPFFRTASAQGCWRDTPCSVHATSFQGEWEANHFAPATRTVGPATFFALDDTSTSNKWPAATAAISHERPVIVFDFGIEVGGIVTLDYHVEGTSNGTLGIAFTEAKNWIGRNSDNSTGIWTHVDGAIRTTFDGPGDHSYTMPDKLLRGGFRWMTVFLEATDAKVALTNVSLELAIQPTWSNLRAYQGYFHSNDDLLNKIWYSGGYTLQTNAIPTDAGRIWPFPENIGNWENTGVLGPGYTIITDGAKRDRTVWPGDMGVAVPASFASTGDLESVKNALQTLFNHQAESGAFPYAGPPLLAWGSDTYHMWTLVGAYNYVLFTGDTDFMKQNWNIFLKGMSYITGRITSDKLLDVSVDGANNAPDWGRRTPFGGRYLVQAQMILYHTLISGAYLADWVGDSTGLNNTWTQTATDLKKAINDNCFDAGKGAFRDYCNRTSIYPQDANSYAILFGVVEHNSDAARSISQYLTTNWVEIGAVTPELPNNISPFVSSFEIQAHLTAGYPQRALDLIRKSWGWYLNNPNGTQSTMVEGYLTDGSFGYRSEDGYQDYSYTSHAHGWATGPVVALSNLIVGLSVTSPNGKNWKLAPNFGDLNTAEGGFTTGLGRYQAKWTVTRNGNTITGYVISWSSPSNSEGQLVLPLLQQNQSPLVKFDGRELRSHNIAIQGAGGQGDAVIISTGSGDHSVEVTF